MILIGTSSFFFPPWHKNSANVWVATVAATWFPSSCLSGLTHFSSLSSPHNPMCMPSLYTRVNLLPPPGCCLAKQLLMPQGMSENKMCIVCRSWPRAAVAWLLLSLFGGSLGHLEAESGTVLEWRFLVRLFLPRQESCKELFAWGEWLELSVVLLEVVGKRGRKEG